MGWKEVVPEEGSRQEPNFMIYGIKYKHLILELDSFLKSSGLSSLCFAQEDSYPQVQSLVLG